MANKTVKKTSSKMDKCRTIFNREFPKASATPGKIIGMFMKQVGISKPHATTYFYTLKSQGVGHAPAVRGRPKVVAKATKRASSRKAA